MKPSARRYSTYEKEEIRKKFLNIAFVTAAALLLLLIISLATRPQVSLPPPPANFSSINLKVAGRMVIPTRVERVAIGEGRQYVEGLRLTVEMPDVPLVMDWNGRDIPCTGEGNYMLEIQGLSAARKPGKLNLRASLKGCDTCYIQGILIPSMPCTVSVPDMTLEASPGKADPAH